MKVLFDTKNIYYLPQYKPVIDVLILRGHQCEVVAYRDKNDIQMVEQHCAEINIALAWVENETAATEYYLTQKPDWIFFANQFADLDQVHEFSKTAQLGHGIGPKPSYYTKSRTPMSVRFIEGSERLKTIQSMFPEDRFEQVGFSKLDPVFSGSDKGLDLEKLGLKSSAKTLLYAPTFNPSSIECFPDNWPTHFADCNILIKAHAFTYSRSRYRQQRKKLTKWSKFKNTYVAKGNELSLLPFMVNADILLSEASSTLFEFASLDRPVIVCDFYHLKWFYRGPFKYRFERRFNKDNVYYRDIGHHVGSYKQLHDAVYDQLLHPEEYKQQRYSMTQKHVGSTDGKASERIVDYLENN